MRSGIDGADVLARRGFAMLAHNGLQRDLGVLRGARVVTINAQPMHLPAAAHLVLADYRNVVLALAGQHARRTADTGVQVNRHPPLMQPVLLGLIKGIRVKRLRGGRRFELHAERELRVLVILIEVRLAHGRPALHGPMVLHGRNRVQPPHWRY